ncbi:MAG: Gfo/Idh/MocA family oxidoreductase, partial [Lentisphaeria bacterium]|nr:Gfo/Idh/MocA family oxidoreductase [Lentisphaeria bacterium]NQZ68558.1 Gfo/Idh/MocA family oxidoreductase [Lentisphaeria bacterium]
MKTHKIGIIGIGMISEFHAKALAEIPNAELVAAHSRSLEKAEKFTAEFGGKAYDSIDEFMADPEIEIVSICTPSGAHAETAIAAAKAGKHVICEKPIEISLERIDAMTQAHADAGTKLCGIFPYRFNDVTNEMKRAVDAGRFGKLTFAAAHVPWWRDQKYYDEGGWKGTQQLDGGGALMNQSIHAVDSLIWLMGDVDSIMAYTDCLAHDNIEVEDTAVACLRFKNGALGLISGTTSIYPGHFRRVEICGNEG